MNEKEKTYIEEDDEIVTLTYDDGETEDFYNLAELDYEGKWYIYLAPVNPTEEFADDEVIIYEMAEDADGNEEFLPIEDDSLLEKLIDLLNDEAAE